MNKRFSIAVLASGRGSNLDALLAARAMGRIDASFALVAGDRAEAPALRKAEGSGIATLALDPAAFADRAAFDRELFDRVAASGADLVVLAGFMRILDGAVIQPWSGRIINIHPSLLPRYRGLHTHRKALAAGDTEHGASVHFVTAELDGGPVIAQARIAILPGDTEQSLAERLLAEEHRLLPAVTAMIAEGRIGLGDGGKVLLDGAPIRTPLQLEPGSYKLRSAATGHTPAA